MTFESILALVIAAAGLFAAFIVGKDFSESKRAKKDKESRDAAKKISDKYDSKSDDSVRRDADRWVRSDKR